MLRTFLVLALGLLVTACTNANDLDGPTRDLGDFSLGHNVVVSSKMQRGPMSREADQEVFAAAMKKAIDERFSRYDGDKMYHLGVSIEGYVLAQPGIPLVLSPKSILIVNVSVWDDLEQKKLTEKPEQITVFESLSGDTLVGSGYTKSAEEQMENLTRNAAKLIENWLVQNRDWFGPKAPRQRRAPVAATPADAAATTVPAPVVEKVGPAATPATAPAATVSPIAQTQAG
ncbi:hypothetical protein [Pseudooceanicola aestuarii]|uniref:hypothetical protein n=1 Tax=Pseudooceanicola aestuarii TaxID=2697319 RepID=UPI0013D02510|nr:hypothetical protein [Pseudooceanicola aestuarii]